MICMYSFFSYTNNSYVVFLLCKLNDKIKLKKYQASKPIEMNNINIRENQKENAVFSFIWCYV